MTLFMYTCCGVESLRICAQKMPNEKLQQIRFISPVGSVGGGISGAAVEEAMAQAPDFIACDAEGVEEGEHPGNHWVCGHGRWRCSRRLGPRDRARNRCRT